MLGHYSTSLSRQELKNTFLAGCKKREDFAVGVEWEKIGVYRDDGDAVRYSGARGVQAIFEALISQKGWEAVPNSSGLPIALKKGGHSITLEPGGQIELSGQKARRLADNAHELLSHLKEIKEISDPLGVVWLGLGAQPFSAAENIEWVPKDRYAVMRSALAEKGPLTYRMMKETASVQISVDYLDEKDAVKKLRLAMALSPVLTALFANSPLEKGVFSGALSRRARIWRGTDPERTGILWNIFGPSFSFDDYVEYALNVPLLFLQRGGRWIGVGNIPFGEFLKNGWGGFSPEPGDWDLHLTSLFTEARLKTYVELRSIDCQSPPLGMAAAALIKGLFYHPPSLEGAWDLVGAWTLEERRRLMDEAPRTALKTKAGPTDLLEVSRKLYGLAEAGLPDEEKNFLWPLEPILRSGLCPAERLLAYLDETARNGQSLLNRLIQHDELFKTKS